jgi:hypothetical protein
MKGKAETRLYAELGAYLGIKAQCTSSNLRYLIIKFLDHFHQINMKDTAYINEYDKN